MHNVGDREINILTWKEVLRKTVLLKNGFMSFDLMSDIISRLRNVPQVDSSSVIVW